ncbi:prepilin-type N-terminal cleavage/methylation domain-containing protein [Opitutaceae bacterium TAV4]|nr:prepilin-type N-terminal cleavage/methylation domain-containing protein [Opitutaceae bacterium TAV4]RRK01715.1 prepilin-type N-terminal cleavage/methylation domain-containing protein [Opitutaceae bacterium TAV3]
MPPPSPPSRVKTSAFTLIELLTVIAIIGILAAIMIPAVGKVRQQARLSQCLSNQRQVATAYLLYLGDNKNMLWRQVTSNAGHKQTQPKQGEWTGIFGPQTYANSQGYLCRLLEPYGLRRAEWNAWTEIPGRMQTVWYCPLTASSSDVKGHGSTYRYYFLGHHIGVTDRTVSATAVTDYWSTKPFLADHYGNHSAPEKRDAPRDENIKNAYAFLDGHVKYYSP